MADSIKKRSGAKSSKCLGDDEVRAHTYSGEYPRDNGQRTFALRWLREKEIERDGRDKAAQWYSKWTFWAAVAAVVTGVGFWRC